MILLFSKTIDPDVDIDALSAADVKSYEQLSSFIDAHTCETTFTYQIKKCDQASCTYCSTHPLRIKDLKYVPAPLLDELKVKYRDFDELYGTKPDGKDQPSLKFSIESVSEDKVNSLI